MPYTRRNWQNAPSSATPLNAAALNNIEDGVEAATEAIANLPATFVSVEGEPADGDAITWDETSGTWVPAAVEGGGTALTVLSEAEGNAGTATTARAISAARLVQQIQQHAVSTIPNAVVRSVIVTTGTEPRPTGADLVVWIDLDNEGTPNADTTDIVFSGQSSSVPAGGTTDQVLAKASGADGDTYWRTVDGGGGGGASLIMPVGKGMQFVPWDNTLGNLGFQNGAVNLIPVYVKQEVTFNKLLLMAVNNDAVDATGRIVAGIYSVASGQPGGAGTLLHTFEDRAITGVTEENWFKFGTTDYTVPPGLYYLAFLPYNFTGLPDGWRTGGRGQWDTTISYGVGHFDPGDPWLGNPARTVRYVMDGTGLSALPANTTALSAQSSNDPIIPAVWIVPS